MRPQGTDEWGLNIGSMLTASTADGWVTPGSSKVPARGASLWSTVTTMVMTITGGELAYCSLASAHVREKASVFSSNSSLVPPRPIAPCSSRVMLRMRFNRPANLNACPGAP